ncbi:MAG: hypothetical protein IJ428_06615 [Clostridia bacterium]|nr:hypothetical protein [Clostridia bacterium]
MLKAGFARVDITPPFGSNLSGYFYARSMDGIRDVLELNALAVGNGEDTVVVIAADLIGCVMTRCDEIRSLIEKRSGVPADHVYIHCMHQHTSVRLGKAGETDTNSLVDDEYISVLIRKFADVAQLALADMCDAEVSTATAPASEPIAFIRRYYLKDGTIVTNPPAELKEQLAGMVGEPDNTMRLVRFKREGAKDIALVNFSTHPDVIGGTKVSADWPGFTRRFVEADIADVSCVFINGAQGDSNHLDFMHEKRTGYEHSRFMGRIVADAVLSVWDKTTPAVGDKVTGEIEIVYNKTRTEGEERYEECKKFYEDYEAGLLGKPHITVLAEACRIIEVRTAKIYRPVPVSVVSFGNVALVGFGGEPFTAYATQARAVAPDKFVITNCCTNGYEGYLPTASAFEEGGYEAKSSRFSPNLEEQCIGAAKKLLAKI